MAEELLKEMSTRVKEGEKQLDVARMLIAKLKTAGEDVSSLERQYKTTKARLDRYKTAFK